MSRQSDIQWPDQPASVNLRREMDESNLNHTAPYLCLRLYGIADCVAKLEAEVERFRLALAEEYAADELVAYRRAAWMACLEIADNDSRAATMHLVELLEKAREPADDYVLLSREKYEELTERAAEPEKARDAAVELLRELYDNEFQPPTSVPFRMGLIDPLAPHPYVESRRQYRERITQVIALLEGSGEEEDDD